MDEFRELCSKYETIVSECWIRADGGKALLRFLDGKRKWFRKPSKAEKYILKRYGRHIIQCRGTD